MKQLLLIGLLLISGLTNAANYHVKTGGNDAYTGLSDAQAWATILKVNSYNCLAGDSILFKRGDTFIGTLSIEHSGTIGNPIVISAYGTGAKPVITGFATITGWTNYGNGIYYKKIAVEAEASLEYPDKTYSLSVDDVNTTMGRYPNTGWLTYEGFTYGATVTVVDNQLSGTPNWTGAEAVIRRVKWMTDRNTITSHSGTTFYADNGSNWNGVTGNGYYFQNDIRTLDILGEWCYKTDTLYMYFGAVNPTTKTVKFATINRLAWVEAVNYQTYDKLDFEGAKNYGFYLRTVTGITIQNCTIGFIGNVGIYSPSNSSGLTATIDNNIIKDCNSGGIRLTGTNSNGWIKNNTISNIGMLQGMCAINASDYWGDGIKVQGHGCLVEYNSIINVGHSGIAQHHGNNIIIRNNYINGFGFTRYDAGGIYAWNYEDGSDKPTGQKIQHNIVLTSNHVAEGINGSIAQGGGIIHLSLWGIYLDVFATNIEVSDNTVSNCKSAGLLIYASNYITVKRNLLYNNEDQQMHYADYGAPDGWRIRHCDVTDNQFISKTATQSCLYYFHASLVDSIKYLGIENNNYFARPIDDNATFRTVIGWNTPVYRTLEQWRTYSGLDMASFKSPVSIPDTSYFRFLYNNTSIPINYSLSVIMKDVKNSSYSNSITLQPYESIVLIGNGTITGGNVYIPPPSSKTRIVKYNGKVVKYNKKVVIY